MKRFLIWLGKVVLMTALLLAAGFGCLCVRLRHGLGFGTYISNFDTLIDIVLCLAIFVLCIFICVKISRFGTKNPDSFAGFWEKAKQPLITIIPALLLTACVVLLVR